MYSRKASISIYRASSGASSICPSLKLVVFGLVVGADRRARALSQITLISGWQCRRSRRTGVARCYSGIQHGAHQRHRLRHRHNAGGHRRWLRSDPLLHRTKHRSAADLEVSGHRRHGWSRQLRRRRRGWRHRRLRRVVRGLLQPGMGANDGLFAPGRGAGSPAQRLVRKAET